MQNEEFASIVKSISLKKPVSFYHMLMDINQLYKLKKINIDMNGHFLSKSSRAKIYGFNCPEKSPRSIVTWIYPSSLDDDTQSEKIIAVIEAAIRGEVAEPVEFTTSFINFCGECGERLRVSFDGKTLRFMNPCSQPEGALPYSFDIQVPSGKLYVANYLADLCPDAEYEWEKAPDNTTRDINTTVGSKNVTLDYAARNMIYVFVGNSCPGVYRQKSGQITVASGAYNYDSDEDILPEGEGLGWICTDLWWYSMMDATDVKNRFNKHIKNHDNFDEWIKKKNCQIIDVEPGNYRVNVLPVDNDDGSKPVIYTTMDLI